MAGRPPTGQRFTVVSLRAVLGDWKDLNTLKAREAHAIARQLIAWYLRRPGAKLPQRPGIDEINAVTEARQRRDAEQDSTSQDDVDQ